MAYNTACIGIAREVGARMASARRARDAAYANARMYETIGMKGRAGQMRRQADMQFNSLRESLLDYMEINGC